jgi:hypothetical protein
VAFEVVVLRVAITAPFCAGVVAMVGAAAGVIGGAVVEPPPLPQLASRTALRADAQRRRNANRSVIR